ncbi:Os05g0268400, partial [Oryza sativa Japonica Group]
LILYGRSADTKTKRCCKWHLRDSIVIVPRISSSRSRNFVSTTFYCPEKNYLFFVFLLEELLFLLFYRFSWSQKHVTGLFLPGIQINNTYAALSIWWQVAKTQQITECTLLFDLSKMQVARSYF